MVTHHPRCREVAACSYQRAMPPIKEQCYLQDREGGHRPTWFCRVGCANFTLTDASNCTSVVEALGNHIAGVCRTCDGGGDGCAPLNRTHNAGLIDGHYPESGGCGRQNVIDHSDRI